MVPSPYPDPGNRAQVQGTPMGKCAAVQSLIQKRRKEHGPRVHLQENGEMGSVHTHIRRHKALEVSGPTMKPSHADECQAHNAE